MEPPFRLLVKAPMCDGERVVMVVLFDGIVWSLDAVHYIVDYFREQYPGVYIAAQADEIREID